MNEASRDFALLNNDLFFKDGDIGIAESDVQHVNDTLAACPGWWKENPPDGIAVLTYLNAAGREQELNRITKIQLQSDGYRSTPSISVDASGLLNMNPNAERQ